MDFISYFNSLAVIGDALVASIGTIVAAVLGALAGVLTYIYNARREAGEARKERDEQRQAEQSRREHEINEERRLKEERIDDFVRALHAEIITGIVLYEDQMPVEEVRYAVFERSPFTTPDETDFVFDAIQPELTILPSTVIHSVVSYYRAQKQTNLIIGDFRHEAFERQSAAAKQRFMEGYVQLLFVLKQRGEDAVRHLEEWAEIRGYGEELKEAGVRLRKSTRQAVREASRTIAKAKKLGAPAEGAGITRLVESDRSSS